MSLLEGPTKELDEKCAEKVVKFVSDVKNGKIMGSNNTALATLTLLEQIIADSKSATAFELIKVVRASGRVICRALPRELVPANMVRRVLRAIRDEHRAQTDQSGGSREGGGESLAKLVLGAAARREAPAAAQPDLREPLRDHVAEIRAELEASTELICAQARAHVHAGALLLTCGASRLLERFCAAAAATTPFRLVVAEGPDHKQSQAMAARLSASGVDVTVITSAAVAGFMSRVNKVVVCVRAALAGGAALGGAGVRAVAVAARHHRVPVIALAPLYKLSPLYECERPQLALPASLPEAGSAPCELLCARHVTLFVSGLGGSSPSYVYRLLSELYDPCDYQI